MINPIRFGGIASGLDTDSIVKDLMKAERMPMNKLLQKKQLEEWKRADYREMNSLLLELRNKAFDMKLQGTFQKKSVTSDNTNIVTATQKGTPTLSSYSVEITTAVTEAKPALVQFKVDNTVADASTALNETYSFTINGSTQIDVVATDSINSVIAKINAVSSTTGVTAAYLADDKTLTFTTTTSGSTAKITIGGTPPANKLRIVTGTVDNSSNDFASATATGVQSAAASPGTVKINGLSYSVNSNKFTFDGIEFNLKKSAAYPVSTVVNVKPDEEAVFDSIKGFVDKYNEIIESINKEIKEERYPDYLPLLDEEREALSDTQAELWEEKAKSGLLRRDSLLTNALTEMRRALMTNVSGVSDTKFDSLSEIGITTGSYYENGKLYINETKLREAISQNGTKVMELFTNKSDSTNSTTKSTNSTTKYNYSGIATRLYDQIDIFIDKITEKAGSSISLVDNSTMGKNLTRMNEDIAKWERRLQEIEDRYWRKFTAMEKAMSQFNSQGSWLAQQFGGGA